MKKNLEMNESSRIALCDLTEKINFRRAQFEKIRIENGQPIFIDRKERASLTPMAIGNVHIIVRWVMEFLNRGYKSSWLS